MLLYIHAHTQTYTYALTEANSTRCFQSSPKTVSSKRSWFCFWTWEILSYARANVWQSYLSHASSRQTNLALIGRKILRGWKWRLRSLELEQNVFTIAASPRIFRFDFLEVTNYYTHDNNTFPSISPMEIILCMVQVRPNVLSEWQVQLK